MEVKCSTCSFSVVDLILVFWRDVEKEKKEVLFLGISVLCRYLPNTKWKISEQYDICGKVGSDTSLA